MDEAPNPRSTTSVPAHLSGTGQERRAHAATVVGVVVAGVLASIVVPGPYDFGSTMIGLTLLAVLFSYGDLPISAREAIGFSAAVSLSMLLAIGVFFDRACMSPAGRLPKRPRNGGSSMTPLLGGPTGSLG